MAATHQVTRNLGGDRLGSGNKNNIHLHNYNRSTHDLSRVFRSSMTVGTLVPFFKELALNGDTFTIDLKPIIRTIPTIAPLYGTFKLQLDIFECPIRLYNGLLHNNMTKIGMNMSQVKLPKLDIVTDVWNPDKYTYNRDLSQVSTNALIAYLGIRGFGDTTYPNAEQKITIERDFNAVPILAYYDIYKNYYANKQEEKGVYIEPSTIGEYTSAKFMYNGNKKYAFWNRKQDPMPTGVTYAGDSWQKITTELNTPNYTDALPMLAEGDDWSIEFDGRQIIDNHTEVVLYNPRTNSYLNAIDLTSMFPNIMIDNNSVHLGEPVSGYWGYSIYMIVYDKTLNEKYAGTKLATFDLQNIDDARIKILQDTGLNNELKISMLDYPYKTLTDTDTNGENVNRFPQCGLAIKTYQSDLLQNWLETEWIDGTNGINQITAIDVSSGSFTIDALNLANKVYNMLNRIAVSGGSYEDWQEAVYTTDTNRRAETPVYKGGMSAEIMFSEVVSNAATDGKPLGTLAGKGGEYNQQGGYIEVHVNEPSYIIGLVSITPRIDYSQGNDWDMCELNTMDDLHKPALDGIGFEDLLQERGAWWGTYYDQTNSRWVKLSMGKVPAWINYMTAINKSFGDFADEDKAMYMTLNRKYSHFPKGNAGVKNVGIMDVTTYIDPTKYNYAFADSELDAQNFWVQIGIGCEARRVMSAKIIPNL